MPTATSSREHLEWATARALEYYDTGDKKSAFASFLSDVTKHDGTAWIAGHSSTLMLLELGWKGGRSEFKRMMSGFATPDPSSDEATDAMAPVSITAEDKALQVFFGTLAGGSLGDSISSQESAGQSIFINSTTLPNDMYESDRTALEQAGIVFGEIVAGDDLFVNVTLPEGWRKAATDHSMWSDLVDKKGRKRASIFYKAAFYDRSARLHTVCRFDIRRDYGREDDNVIVMYVTDGEEIVFTSEEHSFSEKYSDEHEAKVKTARSEAVAWLAENFPDYQNPAAYWD